MSKSASLIAKLQRELVRAHACHASECHVCAVHKELYRAEQGVRAAVAALYDRQACLAQLATRALAERDPDARDNRLHELESAVDEFYYDARALAHPGAGILGEMGISDRESRALAENKQVVDATTERTH